MRNLIAGVLRGSKALAAFAALLLLASAGAASAQQPLKKITVALGGDGLQISTLHIAIGGGFFKEEGLEVELVDVNSGPRQVAALSGGSALFAPLGMIHEIKINAQGGGLVAAANMFGILDIHVVLSKDAIAKTGITQSMSVEEKLKRMKGLRIGISSPGSTTDTTIRTMFKARGMDPDQWVQLQPLGGGSNMLATLEKGLTDGFVWSAPQPQIAEKKGFGQVVINPFDRNVAEMIDVPYEVMAINRATAKENEDVIRKSVRAMTKGMKFTQEHPDQALAILKKRFPEFDPDIMDAAWKNYVKGVPSSPVIPQKLFDNTQHWLNITASTPYKTKYEDVVMNQYAEQAAKDILGK